MRFLEAILLLIWRNSSVLGDEDPPKRRQQRRSSLRARSGDSLNSKRDPGAIAVCFVGQFIRHKTMSSRIGDKLGNNITYHAFVTSSTQHEELSPNDVVDGPALCSSLVGRGFDDCQLDLQPYDAGLFETKSGNVEFQR